MLIEGWTNVFDAGPALNPHRVRQRLCCSEAYNILLYLQIQYVVCYVYPANTGRRSSAGRMLAHRLRRWPNIERALDQRPVLAG